MPGPIRKWFMERHAKKELKKLESLFAPDATITVVDGSDPVGVSDYIATMEDMYASFPDLTIDADEAALTDDVGDGVVEVDATISGTFTGAAYAFGDGAAAVEANGTAVSKEVVFKMTVLSDKITDLVIVGGFPQYFYETVAAVED